MNSIDLSLPKDKLPAAAPTSRKPSTISKLVGPTYAIGSSQSGQEVYGGDLGLFSSVHEAWKNHWNLRTSPEDWWFLVACRIAKAADKAAKEDDNNGAVRKMFVDHEGKENICVDVDVYYIEEVEYDSFFEKMASEITSRIKVPEYARSMQNDFSTSTTTHCIASQINLMASMQEFFSYEMGLCGCGIKAVEMIGEQEDWDCLLTKFQQLRKELEPIKFELSMVSLFDDWFDHVEHVFRKLAETYSKRNTREICDFWANILMIGDGWKYGPSGFGGHAAKEYNGWFVELLLGHDKVLEENFFSQKNKELMKAINTVPMKVTIKYKEPPVSVESELMAGIIGYELHTKTFNDAPSVQPHHMWAMKLPPDSLARRPENRNSNPITNTKPSFTTSRPKAAGASSSESDSSDDDIWI